METMIEILNKQLQLLEIELGDYSIAKKQGLSYTMPEIYYAGIAHTIKNLQLSVYTLKQLEKMEKIDVSVH